MTVSKPQNKFLYYSYGGVLFVVVVVVFVSKQQIMHSTAKTRNVAFRLN